MVDFKHEPQSAIDAHGIIGDMRSAALVNDKGSVDFFCWPEFDSPSIFCALLDTPDAGIFQLTPDLPNARREQIYLPDTNVLQTRWLSDDAVVEITDLLTIGEEDDLPLLIRRVRAVSGHLGRLKKIRALTDNGAGPKEAAKAAGVFWKQEADMLRQVRSWRHEDLTQVLENTLVCEKACKTAGSPDVLLAERLLLEVAGRARRLGL